MDPRETFHYHHIVTPIRLSLQRPASDRASRVFTPDPHGEDLGRAARKAGLDVGCAIHDGSELIRAQAEGYTSVTLGNAYKWGRMLHDGRLGVYDFDAADALTSAIPADLRQRGHTLVWGRTPGRGCPRDLMQRARQHADPQRYVAQAIGDHIQLMMDRYASVTSWDVVNEPMDVFRPRPTAYGLYQLMGDAYIDTAFHAARDARPSALRLINEQIFDYGSRRARVFLDWLHHLLERGVPIDGVGLQSHLMFNEPHWEAMADFLRVIRSMGLHVELTEVDIRLHIFRRAKDPLRAQANAYYQLIRTARRHGDLRGVTFWGLNDGATWLDHIPPMNRIGINAPLLRDRDNQPKMSYHAVCQALEEPV